jgi:pimeloyl-ACP methyl ester carboxylesterase
VLHVTVWGRGEPAVFVHGSMSWGESTWAEQRPLADQYRLLLVDRRGFGDSPGPDAGDWEADAKDIAALLSERAHLVGQSYGAVSSLLAAARVPNAVRSLTVIEPPALGLARGDATAEEFIRRIADAKAQATDPDDYRRRFYGAFGFNLPEGSLAASHELRAAASSWRERPPWETDIPLDTLRAADFPKLVVRGAWDNAPPEAREIGMHSLHRVCDVLVESLGAQEVTFAGAAHNPQALGAPFNERLLEFWRSAD